MSTLTSNKDKIIAVLEREEALIEGHLSSMNKRCGHPGRCALGALLFAVGVPDSELRAIPGSPSEFWPLTSAMLQVEYGALLEDAYGLDEDTAERVMNENDYPSCAAYEEADFDGFDAESLDRVRARCVIDYVRAL